MAQDSYRADMAGNGAVAQGEGALAIGAGGAKVDNVQGDLNIIHINNTVDLDALLRKRKPPVNLCRLFDRRIQATKILGHAKNCFMAKQQVLVYLLSGPSDEGHVPFVERYAAYILRELCHGLGKTYAPPNPIPGKWPTLNKNHEDESFAALEQDILGLLTGKTWAEEGKTTQAALVDGISQQPKHHVIYYQLTNVCRRDMPLLRRWIDFWLGVDLSAHAYSTTVFFCLDQNWSWTPRWISASACCVNNIGKHFADARNVAVLDYLDSPRRDSDVKLWVDTDCKRAWMLEQGGQGNGMYPWDDATLKDAAEKAFGWRRQRPFSKLEKSLEEAVRQAHEVFLKDNGAAIWQGK